MTDKDYEVTVLPDGSAFFVASFPLPETHWIYSHPGDGYLKPPMPFRMGTDDPRREKYSDMVRAAAKYAIKASTLNGAEIDYDPDAMVQNFVIAMLGYNTSDGLTDDLWANPDPIPEIFNEGDKND